jgi:hypothetical protein
MRDFSVLRKSIPALVLTQLPVQGREADRSPPSGTEIMIGGAVPPLHHTSSWCGG